MGRHAFCFRIRPELKEAYQKDHDEIWPEMVKAIKDSGISSYSLFFRSDGTIFGYLESDDMEKSNAYILEQPVRDKWEKAMDKYFVKEDRSTLGPESEELEEVFYLP